MDYCIMFNVEEGGVSTPIEWSKDALQPDRSVIILDEASLRLYLWHGVKQGLVARRTALRQAESLKGHGYTVGKSIIGRDTKELVEIDARKVGRVPEETEKNDALMVILGKEVRVLDNFVVTYSAGEVDPAIMAKPAASKPAPKAEPKPKPKPESKPEPKPAAAAPAATPKAAPKKKKIEFASEYSSDEELPPVKEETKAAPAAAEPSKESALAEVRVALVLKAILDHYDDIWVSKKEDGNYAVEMMDGPIATFKIENAKINFTQNSFSGIDPGIKTKIQSKYVELSKVL